MKRLILALIFVPTIALAHGGEVAHQHPHGTEFVWIGVAAILAGGAVIRSRMRRRSRVTAQHPER